MTAPCLPYVSIRQHTSAYVSLRQHTSAYVSIRQHTSAYGRGARCLARHIYPRVYSTLLPRPRPNAPDSLALRTQGAPAYVSIRQHTSAYVSIRQHTSAYVSLRQLASAYGSIRQHTAAYGSIPQHMSANVSMRQHTAAFVSIRQHTSACVRDSLALRRRGGVEERRLRVRICTFVLVTQVN
jgi:hypothetical protein